MDQQSIKLPGQHNPEFAQAVDDYIKQFHCCITVRRHSASRAELYQWCAINLGSKYRDWFVYEGGTQDRIWCIHIRSPKHATLFRLRWTDVILDSIDLAD
jgi:hypothetical protein